MRKKNSDRKTDGNSFWQSYADMMAAMLLVTTLVLASAVLQEMMSVEKQAGDLTDAQEHVAEMSEELGAAEIAVAEMSMQIESDKEEIDEIQDKLNKAAAEIQRIAGLKREIIEKLKEKFGDNDVLSINEETGTIVMASELLFETDSSELNDNGKAFLESFIPIYMNVLTSEDFKEYISEIIIEGHADTQGSYVYNLTLSQERASTVSQFFLSDESHLFSEQKKEELRKIVTANGRSWSIPIKDEQGNVDMDASRRVEIQFRLKDQEAIQDMIDILQSNTKDPVE